MERRFEKELESLKTSLIRMGSVVEENIGMAVKSLLDDDEALAKKVIEADQRVNALEIEIDNGVIDILALQQPVAGDLRLIIAVQKINNDLERIGDHAVNIAESVVSLHEIPQREPLLNIPQMCNITLEMMRNALDSFIMLDPEMARNVLIRDDEIDDLNREMNRIVIEEIRTGKQSIETGLQMIRLSRNLERVADLCTNIAEDVIFHIQARIIKHNS